MHKIGCQKCFKRANMTEIVPKLPKREGKLASKQRSRDSRALTNSGLINHEKLYQLKISECFSLACKLKTILLQNELGESFNTENCVPRIGPKTRMEPISAKSSFRARRGLKKSGLSQSDRVSTHHKKYQNICLFSRKYILSTIVL